MLRDRFKVVGTVLLGNGKGQDQFSDVREKIVGGLSSSGKISDSYGYVNKVLGE